MKLKHWFMILGGVLGVMVLAGLLFPVGSGPVRAPIAKSQSEVSGLSIALKAFYTEFGTWPTGDQARIMKTLMGDNPQKIVFYDVPPKSLNQQGEFVDSWDTPFAISFSNDGPHVTSAGPNKRFGDKDDIYSWK